MDRRSSLEFAAEIDLTPGQCASLAMQNAHNNDLAGFPEGDYERNR